MTTPKNATTTSRGRTYKWRDEEFDSVTTIINGGVPKPALKAWGERVVAELAFDRLDEWSRMSREEAVDWLKRAPFRTTDKAAVQGSDIHAWIDATILEQPIPEPPLLQMPYCEAFKQFRRDFDPEFVMSEATVYNRKYGFAGTLDWAAKISGHGLVLGDNKTGKGVYGEVAMQLAAYSRAEFIGVNGNEEPMFEADEAMVLHLTPKGYELIPVEISDEVFRHFLYAQQIRRFCNEVSKEVLGTPLNPLKVVA